MKSVRVGKQSEVTDKTWQQLKVLSDTDNRTISAEITYLVEQEWKRRKLPQITTLPHPNGGKPVMVVSEQLGSD